MNHNNQKDEFTTTAGGETLVRSKSASHSLASVALSSQNEDAIGSGSNWGHRNNISLVGAGVDDIIKGNGEEEIDPVEIELSSIIRDVNVGQVHIEFDNQNKHTPDYDDFPPHDVDEPLSPSPRDSEPSDI